MNFVEQFFGVGVTQFEKEVKQDLELQRLQALVTGSVNVSDAAVRTAYLQQGEKVKFSYAVISLDDIKKTINPSDAELRSLLQTERSSLRERCPRDSQDSVHRVRRRQRFPAASRRSANPTFRPTTTRTLTSSRFPRK